MKPLKIHCFQHVNFEDLGCIKDWCSNNGHSITYTRFYQNEPIPNPEDYDWLIIMGGPMNVYEEENYPWLANEKAAIKEAIKQDKTVLGICLGAQLIADVLGAKVNSNAEKEIGWFDISFTAEAGNDNLLQNINSPLKVFHWHGDSFDIPKNTKHLTTSEAYKNQAFLYKNNVLGLQFHLEVTKENLKAMLENGRHELEDQEYIQSEEEILSQQHLIKENNEKMFSILDNLENLRRS